MADKIKPEIKSPGDAWMDHVEKHHNASAATPAYLDPSKQKGENVSKFQKLLKEVEKENDMAAIDKSRGKAIDKDLDKSR
jgi:hypothetical protein